MDLRVAIGMELLATDQADGVHRTPVGGDQKNRCFYTLWPELGVAIYIYIHLCIFIYLYFLTSILLCLYCFIFFASFVFHPFLLFILFYLPLRGYTLVYSFSLTGYLYVFQLVSPAQPSQITLLPRNASPCQVRMNARQPVESRQTMDNRVARLEERTRAWDSTLKVRLSGFTALSKCCHELAAGTRQFWKLKQEIADLMLIDLGPHLKELFPVRTS